MAQKVTIGGNGDLFIGEDKRIDVEVLDDQGNPVDIALFTLQFRVKAQVTDDDANALIDVAATIVGTFDVTRSVNTQRARITLADTDLDEAVFDPIRYQHSLKRTDDGSETIIIYGAFMPELATQV